MKDTEYYNPKQAQAISCGPTEATDNICFTERTSKAMDRLYWMINQPEVTVCSITGQDTPDFGSNLIYYSPIQAIESVPVDFQVAINRFKSIDAFFRDLLL